MKKTIAQSVGLFLVVLCGIFPLWLFAQDQQPTLVIEGGTLIDGNGGTPVQDAVVVIQGNKITSVARKGQGSYPANAQVIKADGKFILPGLWDAQVVYQWYFGEMMLNHGITSTIDVANTGEIAVPYRDAVLHGKLRGPRAFTGITQVVSATPNSTGLESPLTPPRAVKSVQETRDFVKEIIAANPDFIIFQDGSLPLEYYQAGFEEAHKAGIPVLTRAYGPIFGPREAAMLGSRSLPHSAGIGAAVAKNPAGSRNELDLYADMDEAKAKDLIQVLVQHGTALTPTFNNQYAGFPKGWARFEEDDRKTLTDPNLPPYYPADRIAVQLGSYSRVAEGQGPVRERRMKGFQNAMRFHKMFVDAGGHLLPGANTNSTKVPGNNLFHEMDTDIEAGITPMQIIQGATKWSAESLDKQDQLGTVEAGKIADVILVNRDPLQNIDNLRDLNTVIFDGKVVELGYHSWYSVPFGIGTGANSPVEALQWAVAFRKAVFSEAPEGEGAPAAAAGLRDPVESPQPAIETISPTMVTEESPTLSVTLKGFNFVRRSQVYFKGVSVPYKAVSSTELQLTIDADLLKDPGWFDIVVKNPWPITAAAAPWGNGTSNKAHLIVNYKY